MSVNIIIARYNEDISWTNKIKHKVTIYNKGNKLDGNNIIELPNVGREGETFLRHIVNNYENLDDVTVFLQGNPFEHLTILVGWRANLTEDEKDKVCNKINNEINANTEFTPFYQVRYNVPNGTNNVNTTEYCRKYYGENYSMFTVVPGAQYIVPKNNILARPLEFWKRLQIAMFNNDLDGYAQEQLWWLAYNNNMDYNVLTHDYEKDKLLSNNLFGFHNHI